MTKPASPQARPRKRLVFHIGDHKTGSTSVQTAFASASIRVKGQTPFFPTKLSHNWLREHCQAYAALNKPKAKAKAINTFKNLGASIRESEAEFCLISGESLEGIPAAVMKEIIDRFFAHAADEIRVIAYVRPHAGRFTSGFTERVKTGLPNALKRNLDSFFTFAYSNGAFLYAPRFQAWRDQFGTDFILRPMVRDQLYKESVVEDFILHAFDTRNFDILGKADANESLCLEDLMRLKVLQLRIFKTSTPQLRHAVGWEFARLIARMPPPETRTKLRLHKSLAKQVHSAYLEDARTMDREFFDGQPLLESDLERAVKTAPAEALSMEPADHLSATDMRSLEVMASMIDGLLRNKDVSWVPFLRANRIRDIKALRAAITEEPVRPS